MKGAILVSTVVSSVVSIIATIVALNVLAPAVVEAQETRIRAERVTVVDESGTDRVTMYTVPGARSDVDVLSQAGILQVSMGTGSTGEARVLVFAPEGPTNVGGPGPIARLGTDSEGVGSVMLLRDRQGQIRIWLRVDADGNPSIEMRDASGNVTWRAQ